MKTIAIIGAGTGLSQAVAETFSKHGFALRLISRNAQNLEKLASQLKADGIDVDFASADAGNSQQLSQALKKLEPSTGFDVVLYNAAALKAKDILEETSETLTRDFEVNTAGALNAIQTTYNGLKATKGAFLLTGGGLALTPSPDYGTLSIGKAGLRSLAFQLHDRLKPDGIYVGLLTVAGFIDAESETHSPELLAKLFWQLYEQRAQVEFHK
ncbi:SDR family NAD(P)-dependent oxidoreductase [Flavobacterium sp.]|uniref:SDR family NAD(P)-dependent oxidoreductase n=1 Tax=Flavobacterium sp. TaxID=239 RepID=UPI0011FD2EB6|nr:SDR family NAD(P)-dependent oxidoreductase [Flavobacterium sp.]RZJ72553.1 MAG: SDR family NAD(P)-dependent oxidoreductase [Flavobacterium sp.]